MLSNLSTPLITYPPQWREKTFETDLSIFLFWKFKIQIDQQFILIFVEFFVLAIIIFNKSRFIDVFFVFGGWRWRRIWRKVGHILSSCVRDVMEFHFWSASDFSKKYLKLKTLKNETFHNLYVYGLRYSEFFSNILININENLKLWKAIGACKAVGAGWTDFDKILLVSIRTMGSKNSKLFWIGYLVLQYGRHCTLWIFLKFLKKGFSTFRNTILNFNKLIFQPSSWPSGSGRYFGRKFKSR